MKLTQLLVENQEIASEIQQFLDAGEISKAEFESLKYKIDKKIKLRGNQISEKFVFGKTKELDAIGLYDLAFSVPETLRELASLKTKLAKVKTIESPLIDALQDIYSEYSDVVASMAELKTKIVTITQKREIVKKATEVQKQKRFSDSQPLVVELETFIKEYIEKAAIAGEQKYQSVMQILDKNDWNLDTIAPQPNSRMSRGEYQAAKNYRMFIQSLVANQPEQPFVREDIAKKRKYIQAIKDQAEMDYHAWINKMTEKIGKPVVAAKMTGNPWVFSNLTVTTDDGETQVWKTQMIINTSKFGKLFNQFPSTRKT